MPCTPESGSSTLELLRLWHLGDRSALEQLLGRHLEELHSWVSAKLNRCKNLRRGMDSMDFVQRTALVALDLKPRFLPKDGAMFQMLLRRIVWNDMQNHLRAPAHSQRQPTRAYCHESVLDLQHLTVESLSPAFLAGSAERAESVRALIGIALEFLPDPADRELVFLAKVEELGWEEVGRRLGIGADAARMRWERRIRKQLARCILKLTDGKVDDLLDEDERQAS